MSYFSRPVVESGEGTACDVAVEDFEHVKRLCRSFGADEAQAAVMAKQLMKRAEQIARERNCDQVEAMRYLLDIALQGAQGESPPGFEGGEPPPPQA